MVTRTRTTYGIASSGFCFHDPEYAVRLVNEPERVTFLHHELK